MSLGSKQKKDLTWIRKMINNPADGFPVKHTFQREIEKGAEGVVNEWTRTSTGEVVAVKVIRPDETAPSEVDILTSLPPHDSIVACLAVYDKQPVPDTISIVLEYCPAGDLHDFLWNVAMEKNEAVFSERFMWAIFKQLLGAIAFLHEGKGCENLLDAKSWKPIIHRDIKRENILIQTLGSKDDWSEIVIKLADFGLSTRYDPASPDLRLGTGTMLYWPPENSLRNMTLTPAADVWAVGAVIHELAHTFPPVIDTELAKQIWFTKHHAYPYPRHWSESAKRSYWLIASPRKVVPINTDEQEPDERRVRPTPKYSDSLNHCLMMSLSMNVNERPGSGALLAYVEEAHTVFLLQELGIEDEKETETETVGKKSMDN